MTQFAADETSMRLRKFGYIGTDTKLSGSCRFSVIYCLHTTNGVMSHARVALASACRHPCRERLCSPCCPSRVPRHQHLPLFHGCRDFHLSVSVSAPTLILVHPTFRVDPDFRVPVPSAAFLPSFLPRPRRSGAFHGCDACPELLPEWKELQRPTNHR